MAKFPRTLSLAVFRVHLENGLAVAIGVGLIGVVVNHMIGFEASIVAATGAVCVSISDQPDPLRQKPWIIGFALISACFFTALSSFTRFLPLGVPLGGFIVATAFTGWWTGLVSAYGKRALSIAMTSILGFVFAMGQRFPNEAAALTHFGLFSMGATIYAVYALVFAELFDDRARRLLLAEAMRAFVDYLRAKATLYNPDADGPAAFRALIDNHAVLADRLQAARDSLFARRNHPMQLKRIDTLIALLDAFETILSSDADFELLRRSARRDLKWRLNALINSFADEVETLTLALRSRHGTTISRRNAEECEALTQAIAAAHETEPEGEAVDHAFYVTASKLTLADSHIATLAVALDRATSPTRLAADLDLSAFRQPGPHGLTVLLNQFDVKMPAMRYAIRLSLAMTTGLGLTIVFPHFAHANWILLTIALIMRANYSVTSQRRWDRVTGTLIGCALAVLLLNLFPPAVLVTVVVLTVGISHAYGAIKYRVSAIGASVAALLLLHFAAPLVHPQFFERIIDTLIGAGLSYVFSFLLPSWERNDLPRIVRGLIDADAGFADAALRRLHQRQPYRLARKKAMDAVAQLSGAIRRLADEPNTNRRILAALHELLGANYLLASDLSSMPVLMRLRAGELNAPHADAAIAGTRARVAALLAPAVEEAHEHTSPPRESLSGLEGNFAMTVLTRRLAHIEHAANKVARLAARPILEDGS